MGMNKHFSRASLLALVASTSIFASAARAESTFVPLGSSQPSGCLVDSLDEATVLGNKTPMCNYLVKCCAGNTANKDKCCVGVVKNGC